MNIETKAKKYLEQHDAVQVSATSDGFLFIDERHAKRHAATLNNKDVKTFKAEEEKPEEHTADETLEQNLTQLAETVEGIDDVDEIYLLQKAEENAEKPRKGALAIFDARIEQLLEDDSTGDNDIVNDQSNDQGAADQAQDKAKEIPAVRTGQTDAVDDAAAAKAKK